MAGEIVLDEGRLRSEGFEVGLSNASWLGGTASNGVLVTELGMKSVVRNTHQDRTQSRTRRLKGSNCRRLSAYSSRKRSQVLEAGRIVITGQGQRVPVAGEVIGDIDRTVCPTVRSSKVSPAGAITIVPRTVSPSTSQTSIGLYLMQ